MHERGLGRKADGIIKILQKKVNWKPHEINLELETDEIAWLQQNSAQSSSKFFIDYHESRTID